ncbi:AI-2E family transporter [Simiduia curdlanivorans]|uniref:AI-2E family transporter n=1 Tax=Simiduia curdlanivorans TaxID=1492769 RepID=A0ABV8V4J0_9GAMM|nr:AI-2E family transporter [Simiduia curdlanivorans]MDN3641061.1 AI-2E family transporter [Simiduia curdlanivorans]
MTSIPEHNSAPECSTVAPATTARQSAWTNTKNQQIICACLIPIALVTSVAGLYYGKSILFPITLAWLLSLLLSPLVRWAGKFNLPNPLSAALVVALLLGNIYLIGQFLAEPAAKWLEKMPQKTAMLKSKLNLVHEPLAELKRAGEQVAKLAQGSTDQPIVVSVQDNTWMQNLLTDDLPALSGTMLIVVVLTYFLLASRGSMVRQAGRFGSDWSMRRQLMRITAQVRQQLSTYLATIALVNLMLALATSTLLWSIDFPNPLLWGMVAGLLNFAPYVGPLITLGLLALVGLTSFDSLVMALAAPMGFLVLTALEGQLITPSIVGYRMSLSPTMVFLAVVFWTWLWGVAGALMAAPILACVKILCENLSSESNYGLIFQSQ